MIPLCARERAVRIGKKERKEHSGATAIFVLTWLAIFEALDAAAARISCLSVMLA
jgi:hypothetical protein